MCENRRTQTMKPRPRKASKSRVMTIKSEKSWNFIISKATLLDCPIVVHFAAYWCIHSIVMKPCFEELALTYKDLLFLTVDVDDVQEVARKMDVKAMPTFVLMKEGAVADKFVGANPNYLRKTISAFMHSFRSSKKVL